MKKLQIKNVNKKAYRKKGLSSFGPEIWNSVPELMKVKTSFAVFQNKINNWFGKQCMCNLGKFVRKIRK